MVRFSQQNHFDSLGSFDFFGFFCLIDKIIFDLEEFIFRLNGRRHLPSLFVSVISLASTQVGWKYQHVISTLEAKRKVKASVYYKKKRADVALKAKAAAQVRYARVYYGWY